MKSKGKQNPNDKMLMKSSITDDHAVLFFGKERNRIGCQLRCQAIGDLPCGLPPPPWEQSKPGSHGRAGASSRLVSRLGRGLHTKKAFSGEQALLLGKN